MEVELMVTKRDNRPTDRVNIEQSTLEDGMAEFCNLSNHIPHNFISKGEEGFILLVWPPHSGQDPHCQWSRSKGGRKKTLFYQLTQELFTQLHAICDPHRSLFSLILYTCY